nr:MFS transporter [Corynebacterium diphtheriae]CAB0872018.1 MFS transporter [Corynebacterium diphtheriae]
MTSHSTPTGEKSAGLKSHDQRWIFLGIISLGLFVVGADNSVLYTALPALHVHLHTSELEGLWIINAYSLVLAGLLLGTGTLGDKIGHRRMFEIGLSVFAGASILAAVSPNAATLITARALLGIGASTMMPASLALLRITFTDIRERNTAIGIWGAVATLGAALGPVLGGFLLEHYYWGSIFLINVPVVIIALVGTYFMAPKNRPNPQRSWDFFSSMFAMFFMVGLVLLIKECAHTPISFAMLALGLALMAVGAALFWWRHLHLDEPLLRFGVFQNSLFSAGVLAATCAMLILSGTELLTTQRFQLAEGFTPLQAGLLSAATALAAFPSSIGGGAIVHKVGFRPLISGGFLVMCTGGALTAFSVPHNTFPLLITGLLLCGFGAGMVMSVSSTAVIGSAPSRDSGMASAMEAVSYEFGSLISVALFGSLFSFFYSVNAPEEIAASFDQGLHHPELHINARLLMNESYATVIWIAAAIGLTCALATAWLLRNNPKETEYAHE